jgi:hypothetical protein
MSEDTKKQNEKAKKPAQLAPKPEKPPVKKVAKKPVKRAESPTPSEIDVMRKQIAQMQELMRERRKEADKLREDITALRNENALLRAGVDPHWTDQAILQALYGTEPSSGPLGAMLAVLGSEINQCTADAREMEARGDRAGVPAYVQAGARLEAVRDQIITLWKQAHETLDVEPSGRASRFQDS